MANRNRPTRSKPKDQTSKPLKRKIHLYGEIWTYNINISGVRLREPKGCFTKSISSLDFTGCHWMPPLNKILPSDIVGYIRREFVGDDPEWEYDPYHRNLKFATKNNINFLETTSAEINKMISKQEQQDKSARNKRSRKQDHLLMQNIDLLLQLTEHQLSCSDANPLYGGILDDVGNERKHTPRVDCARCHLLGLKAMGKIDKRFKLHLAMLGRK